MRHTSIPLMSMTVIWVAAGYHFALAQDKSTKVPEAAVSKMDKVTTEDVLAMLDARVSKLLKTFGMPDSAYMTRGIFEQRDSVWINYESIKYQAVEKRINSCWFSKDWRHPVYGVKIGESRDEVLKAIGGPSHHQSR